MGLQVAGAREVDRIACGVSASLSSSSEPRLSGAQMLLVHHGLLWDRDSRVIDDAVRRRLKALFDAEITLAAYHLALDAHPEVGNNALLARELGIEPSEQFAGIGFGGPLAEPATVEEFAERVREALGSEPLVFAHGPERVERAAVVTRARAGIWPTRRARATTSSSRVSRPSRLQRPRELGILRRRGALCDRADRGPGAGTEALRAVRPRLAVHRSARAV